MPEQFKAIMVSRDENKKQSVDIETIGVDDLMEGDVVVEVAATTINYKDGLAITGRSPVVRHWPMIPGIDFAGTVVSSDHADWKAGDKVILNGWGVGEVHYGAYAGFARVSGDWLIGLPDGMDEKHAMAIGTAGYTAMLSVMALQKAGVRPDDGPILVTGASGGVGSVATAVLAKNGYHVAASTGRMSEESYLKGLGAAEIIDRNTLSEPGRPLDKEIWAGAVDSVGSHTLANVIAQAKRGGVVSACGLAQGHDLSMTVMPFILRGVSLVGIDSVMAPKALREEAWARLTEELEPATLDAISTTIGFDDIIETATGLLDGKVRGRVIVDMSG